MNHLLSAFRPGLLLIVIFVGLFYVTAAAKESGHNEVWSVTVTFGGATFQRSIAEETPNDQVAEIGDKIADGVPMSLTKGTIAMEMAKQVKLAVWSKSTFQLSARDRLLWMKNGHAILKLVTRDQPKYHIRTNTLEADLYSGVAIITASNPSDSIASLSDMNLKVTDARTGQNVEPQYVKFSRQFVYYVR